MQTSIKSRESISKYDTWRQRLKTNPVHVLFVAPEAEPLLSLFNELEYPYSHTEPEHLEGLLQHSQTDVVIFKASPAEIINSQIAAIRATRLDRQPVILVGVESNDTTFGLNLKKTGATLVYSNEDGVDAVLEKTLDSLRWLFSINQEFLEAEEELVCNTTLASLQRFLSQEMLNSVLYKFQEELRDAMHTCHVALTNSNHGAIGDEIHRLKGTSGTLALKKLAYLCSCLEKRQKLGYYDNTESRLLEISQVAAESIVKLNEAINN